MIAEFEFSHNLTKIQENIKIKYKYKNLNRILTYTKQTQLVK